MDPLTMGLIMGGIGLGKSILIDKPKEERQRKLAAETQRYSPWTGLKAGGIQEADPFGSALSMGTSGAMMAQGNLDAAQDAAYKQAVIDNMKTSTTQPNYWDYMSQGPSRNSV
jgi:hypothetical protein